MGYVYRHIRKDTNMPFYIGASTTNSYGRSKTSNKRSKEWYAVTSNTDFEVEILFESEDKDLIYSKEREFIEIHGRKDIGNGTLVNLTDGGKCPQNMSPEIRKAHSIRMTGENNHFFGKKRPDHSAKMKGQVRDKMKGVLAGEKNPMWGKTHSEEIRKKISENLKGKCAGDKNPMWGIKRPEVAVMSKNVNGRRVINTKTGEIFICVRDAAESINMSYSHLKNYLYGRLENKTPLKFLDNGNKS